MGMFTTIVDPKTGLSVQIKVGGDRCNAYNVGEIINELNGCYHGVGERQDNPGGLGDYWVAVKESRVVAIRPQESCLEEDLLDEFDIDE